MKSIKKVTMVVMLVCVFCWMGTCLSANVQQKVTKGKVNINTANIDQLQTLPRIGTKVAERIIEFRKKNGKFKKIEDLMKVRGIGEKTFNKMRNRITVKGSKNGSDN